MKKNKSSKDLNDLANALKNAKEGEDYIKENGKVFVPCSFDNWEPPIQEWQEAKKGNLYARTLRSREGKDDFAEFAPYCYSLFSLIRKDGEFSEIASLMGQMACLAELSARRNEKETKFVFLSDVKFAVISAKQLLFRCDDFLPYIMIDAKGPLRDHMDESIAEGEKEKEERILRVEYEGNLFYAWDIVMIAILGSHLSAFQGVDLSNEEEIRKWYKEMAECINNMVHNTQALLAGAADQFKHI